jgi:hypothetical protein
MENPESPGPGQGLITINPGLLGALAGGGISLDVFSKDILVLECIVSGTSFRKLDAVEPLLSHKVKLEIKREAKNEFDKFAVAFQFENQKVGYIPKNKNETIARLMDAGKAFFGVIEAKEWEGNWLRIEVKVFLKD